MSMRTLDAREHRSASDVVSTPRPRRRSEPITVIGAGPYGLSIAAHLGSRRAGARVRPSHGVMAQEHAGRDVLEVDSRARPVCPARGRARPSRICAACGHPELDEYDDGVPIDVFVGYGDWFAERHRLSVEDEIVEDITADGGFDISLAGGEVARARAVIVANGHVDHWYVPEGCSPRSTESRDPTTRFRTLRSTQTSRANAAAAVAVIGVGQSALESAALLHESGAEVTVLTRAAG